MQVTLLHASPFLSTNSSNQSNESLRPSQSARLPQSNLKTFSHEFSVQQEIESQSDSAPDETRSYLGLLLSCFQLCPLSLMVTKHNETRGAH